MSRAAVRATGRVRELLLAVKASFWFIPSIAIVVAIALGIGLVALEPAGGAGLAERWPRLFGAGAEGARGTLEAIAGSMITVAGVVFSVTLVALSLAASAYSPRVLRTFMHDRPTQAAFGVFVGIFVYCLVVLRTVRAAAEGGGFVPSLALVGALALAVAGVGMLVYFIHHLAVAIQVSTIVQRIADETRATVDRLYPDELGPGEDNGGGSPAPDVLGWRAVPARRTGYIVAVDLDELYDYGRDRDAVLRMELAVGDFAIESQPLVALASGREEEDEAETVDGLFAVASERTIEQDVAFGIQQIVDVAARALSPGINTPGTAALCIDHLGALFARLARRRIPPSDRCEDGKPHLVLKGPSFESLAALAFASLTRDAGGRAEVLGHLERTARLIERGAPPGRRATMGRHIEAIRRARAGRNDTFRGGAQ